MRIPRIYHPIPLLPGEKTPLSSDATQHVKHVLRLKPGAPLRLFSGNSNESLAHITEIQREVVVEGATYTTHNIESPRAIHLWQGLCRGERMDLVIQKATELGVSAIIPVTTERSIVKLDPTRTQKRQLHWERIIISACEQCGRNTLPIIYPPVALYHIPNSTEDLRLLLDPLGNNTLKSLPTPNPETTIHLFIGPEGGLSDLEITALTNKGFTGIQMGPRILRVETAALTAIAVIQSRWGDL